MDDQDDDRQVEHRGAWMTKLVMRCLSAVSAIVLVALTAALTDKWRVRQSYYYSTPPVLVLAPQAGIALAWAVLDVLVMLFMRWRSRPGSPPSSSSRPRRPRRPGTRSDGVHPGLAVTLDLLLWLGFIAGTILFSFMHYVSDPYYSDDYYSFNRDDYDQLSWVHDVGSAVLAFCCLSV